MAKPITKNAQGDDLEQAGTIYFNLCYWECNCLSDSPQGNLRRAIWKDDERCPFCGCEESQSSSALEEDVQQRVYGKRLKHTPLPWRVVKGPFCPIIATMANNPLQEITKVDPQFHRDAVDEVQANAVFIARACNAYYPLREALQTFVSVYNTMSSHVVADMLVALDQAKKVLSETTSTPAKG
jgi:hypothetical protein